MQVLIADDDSISRGMLARMVAKWDYETVLASDGEEAWRVLEREDAPRLAILDWMMPGMTGPALCRELRRAGREPYTYVLLLTARTDKQDVIEGMASGADDYITKPFDVQELEVRLRAGRRILELQSELVSAREALRELATRDPLTCLWNRYAILDILNREAARSAREGTPLSVVLADLDHFKNVNDTYGHLAGDAVLREAARRMQAAVRAYDAVGRYGGEEFLIVLPGSCDASAVQLAERLRAAMAVEPIAVGSQVIRATMSLGVAGAARVEDIVLEELIRAADGALYRAKDLGRNRVEWADLGETSPPCDPDVAALIAHGRLAGSD